jgi:hypothetical protein
MERDEMEIIILTRLDIHTYLLIHIHTSIPVYNPSNPPIRSNTNNHR